MTYYLVSSPSDFKGYKINTDNQLEENLKKDLMKDMKAIFICSDPDFIHNEEYGYKIKKLFVNSGFTFSSYDILNHNNMDKTEELIINADFIILSGGHVPTENIFFNEMHLRKYIQKSKAVVLGFSAGAMNMATTVYSPPEEEGEALDVSYKRYLNGLALTNTQIVPHYQMIKNETVDDLRVIEDIVLKDSVRYDYIIIPDGSYIYGHDDKEILYGEGYIASKGNIKQISAVNETYIIKK